MIEWKWRHFPGGGCATGLRVSNMAVTRSSLLRGVGSGNPDQWREFVRIYSPLIARTVRVRGISGSDLDDITQEVLIKMLRVLPRFLYSRHKGKFRTWLRRVVTNAIIDHRRARRMDSRLQPLPPDVPQLPATDEEGWGDAFQTHLLDCALRSVREVVRPRTWQCFWELAFQKRPAGEISRELGVSENAVYINSSRVMSRVREYCAQHGAALPQ